MSTGESRRRPPFHTGPQHRSPADPQREPQETTPPGRRVHWGEEPWALGPCLRFNVFVFVMQTLWQQNHDPAGNIWLSALVALIPIVFFSGPLTKLRLKGLPGGHRHGAAGLGVALLFTKCP